MTFARVSDHELSAVLHKLTVVYFSNANPAMDSNVTKNRRILLTETVAYDFTAKPSVELPVSNNAEILCDRLRLGNSCMIGRLVKSADELVEVNDGLTRDVKPSPVALVGIVGNGSAKDKES